MLQYLPYQSIEARLLQILQFPPFLNEVTIDNNRMHIISTKRFVGLIKQLCCRNNRFDETGRYIINNCECITTIANT